MHRLFTVLLFVACNTHFLSAQIINIENKRMPSDTTGWFGSLGISFVASKNKSDVIQLGHDGHVQYKSPNHLILYIQDLNLLRANETNFENSGFFHVRYNYKWTSLLRIEAFTQFQFNSLVSVDKRLLAGIGPRLKLSQKERYKIYLGILYMHEWERITRNEPDPDRPSWDNINPRLSSYLSFTLKPSSSFSFTSTTYVQPRFSDFGDTRIHTENSLRFSITSKFSFSTSFRLSYDTEPPEGVPSSVYRISNGLSYRFR